MGGGARCKPPNKGSSLAETSGEEKITTVVERQSSIIEKFGKRLVGGERREEKEKGKFPSPCRKNADAEFFGMMSGGEIVSSTSEDSKKTGQGGESETEPATKSDDDYRKIVFTWVLYPGRTRKKNPVRLNGKVGQKKTRRRADARESDLQEISK